MSKASGTTRASSKSSPRGLTTTTATTSVATGGSEIDKSIENAYDIKLEFEGVRYVNDGEEEYPIKEVEKDLGNGYVAFFQDRPSEERGKREISVSVSKDGADISRYEVTIPYDGNSRGSQMIAQNRAAASVLDILKDYKRRL